MTSTPTTARASSDDWGGRNPLPTRVSKACDRCRRNKSRCDSYRPCSLCCRANVECSSGVSETTNRAHKRRADKSPPSEISSVRPRARSGTARHSSVLQSEDPTLDHDITVLETEASTTVNIDSRQHSLDDAGADSAMSIAQKICSLSNLPALKRTTSAIPGGDTFSKSAPSRYDRAQRRPITSVLGFSLPPSDMMRTLLEEYFDAVHWFSLVIYEPKFRAKFESLADGLAHHSQKSFLLLLSTILGIAAWYKSQRSAVNETISNTEWRDWGLALIKGVEAQLIDLMDQSSISSVQTCVLLGSYYVYHGRPTLSFALLGATIKTAQALALHRETLRGESQNIEERKRVWWTVYTWDRFASVTYGRPLGINDKDCNVSHPSDVFESPFFTKDRIQGSDGVICYSTYQRELNKLYMIASAVIEIIFGIRAVGCVKQVTLAHIAKVTENLWAWRTRLPTHLSLDLERDCRPHPSATERVHHLQALSLQLTFDNLLIIIHRPFLAQQVEQLLQTQPEDEHCPAQEVLAIAGDMESPRSCADQSSGHPSSSISSTEQWWNAAVRTSKVTQMPQLAQLATESHLVAFLAINLFNSAIVMVVMALSSPLSNRALEVKQIVTRIFRLQEILGKRSMLPKQNNAVLRDIIRMLLQREAEAMLAPVRPSKRPRAENAIETSSPSDVVSISVEDTLRLPLQLPSTGARNDPGDMQHMEADDVLRLNESLASVQRGNARLFIDRLRTYILCKTSLC
ncbi:hypothetical protein P153DRAFT_409360 [Dothidotthia symphoricarpi CBS 119687]|uniref:Zn(2)-C6 fungal-type domain-containing protein n=1 Tax=Dothidotthia symphoricarpi CBS 119687 TaxID=1392245 RepID=A0A6A6ATX6_9PLEO|nr:uncharacterized protein P153DRAFT_409360 [Dothidotthia symphoricarpi CBS 119687]KAF2134001.1 hypothetical protein P153DRAFT_409360 [Dothidotthia symphoricarpi CBS 119687]